MTGFGEKNKSVFFSHHKIMAIEFSILLLFNKNSVKKKKKTTNKNKQKKNNRDIIKF